MGALHSEILSKHLAKRVLHAMMNPDAPAWLYKPKLTNLVTKKPAEKTPVPRKDKKDAQVPIEDTTTPAGIEPPDGEPHMFDKLKEMLKEQNKNRV